MFRDAWDSARPTGDLPAIGQQSGGPSASRWRRRGRNVVLAVVMLEVVALCGWASIAGKQAPERGFAPADAAGAEEPASLPRNESLPADGGGTSAPAPRARAPRPATTGAYKFALMQQNRKKPVAYDPCQPIHYVIREEGSPPGGRRLITEGVDRVAEATGLRFVFDGSSDEPPSAQRAVVQRQRYGNVWAPVLISWVTDKEKPAFVGDVAGEAGSAAVGSDGSPLVYVTGTVELDAGQLRKILSERHGTARARAIILHELGHLVGLDHVKDETQLMFANVQPGVVDFAEGDMKGLAALGQGACVPALRRP